MMYFAVLIINGLKNRKYKEKLQFYGEITLI